MRNISTGRCAANVSAALSLDVLRSSVRSLILAAGALVALAAPASAAPVHNPFDNFSVEINPSSTGLSPLLGFNGNRADFQGFGVSNYFPSPSTQVTQTLSATFYADPGYVFTGAQIGVGLWNYAWQQGSGIGFHVDWSVAGSQYVGGSSPNSPTPTCSNSGIGTWFTGSGSDGCFQLTEGWAAQGGGGFTELQLM